MVKASQQQPQQPQPQHNNGNTTAAATNSNNSSTTSNNHNNSTTTSSAGIRKPNRCHANNSTHHSANHHHHNCCCHHHNSSSSTRSNNGHHHSSRRTTNMTRGQQFLHQVKMRLSPQHQQSQQTQQELPQSPSVQKIKYIDEHHQQQSTTPSPQSAEQQQQQQQTEGIPIIQPLVQTETFQQVFPLYSLKPCDTMSQQQPSSVSSILSSCPSSSSSSRICNPYKPTTCIVREMMLTQYQIVVQLTKQTITHFELVTLPSMAAAGQQQPQQHAGIGIRKRVVTKTQTRTILITRRVRLNVRL